MRNYSKATNWKHVSKINELQYIELQLLVHMRCIDMQ